MAELASRVDLRQLARKSRQNLLRIRDRNVLEANLCAVQVSRISRTERRNLEGLQRDFRRLESDRLRAASAQLTDAFLTAQEVSRGRQPDPRPFARSAAVPLLPRPSTALARPSTPLYGLTRRPTSACHFSRFGAESRVCPYFPCATGPADSAESEEESDTESWGEESEEEREAAWAEERRAVLTTPMDRARSLRQRMEEWRQFHKRSAPPPRETRYGKAFPPRKVLKAARPGSGV